MSVIVCGDSLAVLGGLPDGHFNCCVTSPPYWGLRDYGVAGQIGLEKTPEEYVARLVAVFREVRRVLRNDGTLWLNLGDSYASAWVCNRRSEFGLGSLENGKRQDRPNRIVGGLKEKDLVGIPWRVAFALQADGWYLRSDIIWAKPNPMPESVNDRPTKAHEYLFLLAKSEKYYYNAEAIRDPATGTAHDRARKDRPDKWPNAWSAEAGRHDGIGNGRFTAKNKISEPGAGIKYNSNFNEAVTKTVEFRNKRTVWTIPTQPYPEAHFATFPEDLVRPCILAGCPPGGRVLDPFAGSGTTLAVAKALGCAGVGIELSAEYCKLAEKRLAQDVLPLEASA